MTAASKKEVAETTHNDIVNVDNAEWAGMGAEEATQEDYAVPFIQIAQGLSPQIDESEAKYIDGLKRGQYFNTVTGEIFPEGITVIPVKFERKFLEFKLREEGGGLVNIHETYDRDLLQRRDERGRTITDEGTQIVDTRSFYCLAFNNGSWFPVIISMKSTQAKKAKQWMAMMNGIHWKSGDKEFPAPLFANTYRLTTAQEKNSEGSWHGYVIARELALTPNDAEFQLAHEFYKQLKTGEKAADYATQDGVAPASEGDDDLPMQ